MSHSLHRKRVYLTVPLRDEIPMNIYKITTDDSLYETVQHGNSRYPFAYYPEYIRQFDFHRIDWHISSNTD